MFDCLAIVFKARKKRAAVCAALVFVAGSTVSAETLHEAVGRAFANSNARQVAIKSIDAQNKQVGIAQGNRGMSVDLFGEVALENVDDSSRSGQPGNNDTQTARQIAMSVTYPLYDGGQSLYSLFREAALLDAEIVRLSDAAESIALNTIQAYIDVSRRQSIVTLSGENIAVHQRIADQVDSQVEAGKLSEPDRFQASDKLLAAQLAHADARAALRDALSTYQFIVGTTPRGGLSLPSPRSLPTNRAAIENAAVRSSHLLKIAQKDIEALQYQEAIDFADWQPRLDWFLRGGYDEDVDGEPGTETTLSTGIRLNWTLYKGGNKQRTQARNRDLVMRAHYRKKQVEDEVRNLARRSWNSYRSAVERNQLLATTLVNNEKIVDAFKREFEAAKRPLLEVLDAERALFNLKVRRANSTAAVAFQKYRMLAAQSQLTRHFGLSPYGSNLVADFDARVKAAPRGDFDISAPPLDQP